MFRVQTLGSGSFWLPISHRLTEDGEIMGWKGWCAFGAVSLIVFAVFFWPEANPAEQQKQTYQQHLHDARSLALGARSQTKQIVERAAHFPSLLPQQILSETGDWPQIHTRHVLRVAVPYNRTYFYNDNNLTRGISTEILAELERYLNVTLKTGNDPIAVLAVPVASQQLITTVTQGLADVAIGDISISVESLKQVDFIGFKGLAQYDILVAGPQSPTIQQEQDLSGQPLSIRRDGRYQKSLDQLNQRLIKAGKAVTDSRTVPDELEDEDLLEMLNAGLLDFAVIDDRKARLWQPVYSDIRLYQNIRLSTGKRVGWAIRKQSPLLAKVLMGFGDLAGKEQEASIRFAKYQSKLPKLAPARSQDAVQKAQLVDSLVQKYAHQYHFDPLLLLAQGYQLSRLDQSYVSAQGPIGLMQVMPTTGQAMQVGDIHTLEPNLHAAIKYLDELRQKYFNDADIPEQDKMLFALAAYQAGPVSIARMRDLAATQGRDPDRWFGEVELVVARELGNDTARYMRNILKYSVLYDQMLNKLLLTPSKSGSDSATSVPAAAHH